MRAIEHTLGRVRIFWDGTQSADTTKEYDPLPHSGEHFDVVSVYSGKLTDHALPSMSPNKDSSATQPAIMPLVDAQA